MVCATFPVVLVVLAPQDPDQRVAGRVLRDRLRRGGVAGEGIVPDLDVVRRDLDVLGERDGREREQGEDDGGEK
jgi:hypothetical protein